MSNEMIERVAKAIQKSENSSSDLKFFRKYARDAIAAMREPTQEMIPEGLKALVDKIEAMDPECETAELVRNGDEIKATWQAMIDAALKE